jgi:hypothetical protein
MIDDQRPRPMIVQRYANFRSELIDDDWRSHAGGSSSAVDTRSVHGTRSRLQGRDMLSARREIVFSKMTGALQQEDDAPQRRK